MTLSYNNRSCKAKHLSKINSIGPGEAKPVSDNSTDEGKSLNRRVEFKFNSN